MSIHCYAMIFSIMLLCLPARADNAFVNQLASASHASAVQLSAAQAEQLKNMQLTAALAWHGASPWINAVNRGARDTFERYGVKVLVSTDAQYDPVKQVADIENIQALKPDMLLSLIIDGISAKAALQSTTRQGTKLVLLSNPVPGFEHGKDFFGIVTDDMQGMGKQAAQAVFQHLGGKGKVGLIVHDANYFITNTRDNAFIAALKAYSGIEVVAQSGFVKEHDTSAIASAMLLRHPELQLIYVSWDTAAEGVVQALRSDGFSAVRVISHDLGINNLLNMAQDGNMLASVSDRPYEIGAAMARIALLAELGQDTPLFTLVPFELVTKQNISAVWQQAYRTDLPRIISIALGD